MPNPKEVSQKKFEKALGFGYRMDDVDEYLQNVAAEMQEILEEKADLEKKLEILADKLTEYREDEESLRTAILSAQKLGDNVIRESKTKAEIIMRDATIKADAMILNAKRQIEKENESLKKLQREVANFKNRLIALYRQHLELVTALPGEVEGEEKTETKAEAKPAEKVEVRTEPEPLQEENIDLDEDFSHEDFSDDSYSQDEIPRANPVGVPSKFSQNMADDTIEFKGDSSQQSSTERGRAIKRFAVDDGIPSMMSSDDEDSGEIKSSLKSMFDEDDLDSDEPNLSFFNKANTAPPQKQERDLRFGESFKIKRDKSFPRFR